ncbi:MAG: formylglycine-generating enzyme family protein [Odoribacteraceae bacterium]|jgi:formylglycine-generating enzyme required for sulfatase activity|nr:formylglycine-generating enzyme family protein [Odoribacteraceae bacterium]
MKTKFLTIAAAAAFTILATSGGQANAQRHPAEPEMVLVQGGTFRMGSTDVEEGEESDEVPVHEVTVSSFYMGKYEVTQAQWKLVMGTTVHQRRDKVYPDGPLRGEGDNYPMYYVSWDDVQEFIERLNAATGKQYRLPTEAEWEYAARGGNQSRGYQYSGSNSIENVAWFEDNSDNQIHPVGTKQPNELGIHDMSGNVWECCHDWYGPYPDSAQDNPLGASSGSYRVKRGGGWHYDAGYCRVVSRSYGLPDFSSYNLGFRLACDSDAQRHPAEPEMVFVQGGTFRMGATNAVHEVTVSSFYIGKCEVTQAQWEMLLDNNPSLFKGDNLPVEKMSWDDAQLFIERLNVATGKQYRLPTEAEWEYAARGGNQSKAYQYSGSNSIGNVAWFDDNSDEQTHPVGTKQPNELGIHDMNGNVWEWCHDWYGPYPASAQNNPLGPSFGSARVFRGGSWYNNAVNCRVTDRGYSSPDSSYSALGFRLACSSE